ncbi:MAG TPA: hypothetical protein VJV40_07845 [Thermodesulfobacteriota bacterium]|nr:hypothetical protein [Thermodesulfobacteriota bacterium]
MSEEERIENERIEEIRKAAETVEEKVQAKEAGQAARPKAYSHAGKGLMERRASFSQSSVPNAHKGYSGKTPRVMMGIIAVLFIVSFILAGITG